MDILSLAPGIYKVKIKDELGEIIFNISIIQSMGCVLGIAGFQGGEKIPKRNKHYMLNSDVKNWISKMEIVN